MYDLDWDVPQDDAEGVRWKPILIGTGTGFTLGCGVTLEDEDISAPGKELRAGLVPVDEPA